MLEDIRAALREHADESDAIALQRFFKTGPGEYGDGDRFLGVRVPATRRVARKYRDLPLADTKTLLHSAIHEERLLALIILTHKYQKGTSDERAEIYRIYLDHTEYINNWDLVDTSAEHIVGAYLKERLRKPLHVLAKSESLWERRIAIMATFHFIKNREFDETLRIAEMLVADTEDLIHKAVGWMLREVGKREINTEESFLKKHYQCMPRTMLRYAIEKFPEEIRQQYLKGAIRQ
ncbi:DNA alkylation repair enzyme [bacterium BMS3Bbin05]|nr:DNA alkylation repair enzyme [bacterium BMS3Bbin05]